MKQNKRRKCKHVLHEINGIFLFSTKLIYFYKYIFLIFSLFLSSLQFLSFVVYFFVPFSFSRKALQCIRLHLVFIYLFISRRTFLKKKQQNKLSVSMKFNLGLYTIEVWILYEVFLYSNLFCCSRVTCDKINIEPYEIVCLVFSSVSYTI